MVALSRKIGYSPPARTINNRRCTDVCVERFAAVTSTLQRHLGHPTSIASVACMFMFDSSRFFHHSFQVVIISRPLVTTCEQSQWVCMRAMTCLEALLELWFFHTVRRIAWKRIRSVRNWRAATVAKGLDEERTTCRAARLCSPMPGGTRWYGASGHHPERLQALLILSMVPIPIREQCLWPPKRRRGARRAQKEQSSSVFVHQASPLSGP